MAKYSYELVKEMREYVFEGMNFVTYYKDHEDCGVPKNVASKAYKRAISTS